MKTFKEKEYGRDIIDDVVISNRSRNEAIFEQASKLPPYFGSVEIGLPTIDLNSIQKKDRCEVQKLITPLIETVNNYNLEGSPKLFVMCDGQPKQIDTHMVLIKIIKAATALSISISEDFASTMAEFVNKLIDGIVNGIIVPFEFNINSNLQKVLSKELNEYLESVLIENNIEHNSVIKVKKEKKANKLIEAAMIVDKNNKI